MNFIKKLTIYFLYENEFSFSKPYQMGMQDSASPIMEGIIDLHHHILFYLLLVGVGVGGVMAQTLRLYNVSTILFLEVPSKFFRYRHKYISSSIKSSKFIHNSIIETIWTIIPTIILVLIAMPSFTLLYSIDEVLNPSVTFKAIGHQWYWTYEFTDYNQILNEYLKVTFDSFMLPEDNLILGDLRLLETDHVICLPTRTHIRVIVSAADVLHSWAIPSLGIKMDAVPGRLNQTMLFLKRGGLFYGQCSEICGVNHGFMPIAVLGIPLNIYQNSIVEAHRLL